MAKRRSLASKLHMGEVDDEELTMVLSSVLPRGAQFRANEVEYRTSDDEWAVSVCYRDGAVVDVYAGPALTPEIEEAIGAQVEQVLLAEGATKVWRWVLFSRRPVEGCWRYKDHFQIVPTPADAPRPNEVFGADPFLVEFTFKDNSDFRIRNLRCEQSSYELALLLNVFLYGGVSRNKHSPRKVWVWEPFGSSPPVRWAQEGYMIANLEHLLDDFSDTSGVPPLNEIPAESYYAPRTRRPDYLTIPDALTDLFEAFDGLSAEDRVRFLRAAFWYHIAYDVWDNSRSLYVTSIVNAVECLSSSTPARSQDEGVSTQFKNFVKQYGPGAPTTRLIDKVYGMRSDITHGERLLGNDSPRSSWGLNQTFSQELEVTDAAAILGRGALVNWLWNKGGRASPLIESGVPAETPPPPGTKSKVSIVIPTSEDGPTESPT